MISKQVRRTLISSIKIEALTNSLKRKLTCNQKLSAIIGRRFLRLEQKYNSFVMWVVMVLLRAKKKRQDTNRLVNWLVK